MPGEFTALKTRVADHLSGLKAFEDASLLLAFPGSKREFPLKKPLVIIEILAAELAPAGLGGDVSSAEVTLGVSFYCPEPEGCCAYYEALCDALFNLPELSVRKISRGRTIYDAETAAHRADVEAVLAAAWMLNRPGERLFTDCRLQEKEVTV
jgi:hypothetical protein